MSEFKKDTSKDYESLVDFVSEENILQDLSDFLGEEKEEWRPPIKPKRVDAEYPEAWQTFIVNFEKEEDYFAFMEFLGKAPVPGMNDLVYEKEESGGVFDFL